MTSTSRASPDVRSHDLPGCPGILERTSFLTDTGGLYDSSIYHHRHAKRFIRRLLRHAGAQGIVPHVEAKIVASKKDTDQETDLIFTQDTHGSDYRETREGQKLPIAHCIKDTRGWRITKQLLPYTLMAEIFEKPSFGCPDLVDEVKDYDRLVLMGLCTDICVISNAILLKAHYPEKEIVVDSSCCAGSTPEAHEMALKIMQSCQIDIV